MKPKISIRNSSKISSQKYRLIVRCFIADCTATQTLSITQVIRNTVNRYYNLFRDQIAKQALVERCEYSIGNGIEIDESYFGPTRIRGKRGRGAG